MASTDYIKTPRAKTWYPKITEPDVYEGAEGKYMAPLMLTESELKDWKAKALQVAKEGGLKSPKLPFKDFTDKDGNTFTCLMAKSKNKPVAWIGKFKKLPEGVKVGNGSEVRVTGRFSIQKNFVMFYMSSVAILNLVEGGGTDGSEYAEDFEDEGSDYGTSEDSGDPLDI